MDLQSIRTEIENQKAVLLDVREKKEWDEGQLKNARFCPLSELKKGQIPEDLPKDKMIYTHCQSGGRAETAAEILKKSYKVTALKKHYSELKKENF